MNADMPTPAALTALPPTIDPAELASRLVVSVAGPLAEYAAAAAPDNRAAIEDAAERAAAALHDLSALVTGGTP